MALKHNSPKYETFLEAVRKGQTAEVEQHLTEHPEFLDLADRHGWTPLHYAAANGRDPTVELLLSFLPSVPSVRYEPPFGPHYIRRYASSLPSFGSVRSGRQHGSTSLDSTTNDGWTPLHLAVLKGRYSTVKLLLSHEAPFGRRYASLVRSLDSTDNDGLTPLHYAAINGCDSMVELLLSYLPSVRYETPFGPHYIRSYACQQGGTFLDSTNNKGWTLLHYAARYGRDSTVAILRAVGAIVLSYERLSPQRIELLQQPIPEEEVLEIRFRIYFSRSLLSHLL